MKYLDKQSLKILVIGHLPPPQEGTAMIVENIIKSQYINRNFQIHLLSLFKRKHAENRGKFGVTNISHNIINVLHYFFLILKLRPNTIYMPIVQNRLGFLRDSIFILIGKLLRRKMYVHFHGGNFNLFYQMQKGIYKKYIKFILGRVDQLIVLAKKFRKQFAGFINFEKISVLYNSIADSSINLTEIRKHTLNHGKTKILFIGYLSKAKGALDLVKAIPHVLAKYKGPIKFILCGQPVDIERNIVFIPEPHYGYSKIKDFIAQEDLNDYVEIKSEVFSEEKEKMFSQADIFVLPSYSEGCALVVLEAMAFGLPTITTPVGALEEMLIEGDNCLFVNPGDIKGLSEKILFLLQNPYLRQKMGELNRKLIRDKYNPDIFLHELASIWFKS